MEPTEPSALVEKLQARAVIARLVPDINSDSDTKPSEFIKQRWEQYKRQYGSNNNLNGKVFETLISIVLCRRGIVPHYIQAKVAHIPGVNYDCIVFTREIGPISISAKVSLRERWKQADLEALALKNIHRRAQSYLVSMEETEVRRRQSDPGSAMALNGFILASSNEFDTLLDHIASFTPIEATSVVTVTGPLVASAEWLASFYR